MNYRINAEKGNRKLMKMETYKHDTRYLNSTQTCVIQDRKVNYTNISTYLCT